jgi:hypothetical protein
MRCMLAPLRSMVAINDKTPPRDVLSVPPNAGAGKDVTAYFTKRKNTAAQARVPVLGLNTMHVIHIFEIIKP